MDVGFKIVDVILNVALFLPIGFLRRGLGQAGRRVGWRAVAAACALSTLVEFIQVFLPGRYPSPVDVVTNTAGAWGRGVDSTGWDAPLSGIARRCDRIGLDTPVVGLLYLGVPEVAG